MNQYKKDFPALSDAGFSYLDSAATSQKPQSVISAVENYYKTDNANPHRGAYQLSIRATEIYETARARVAAFINAPSSDEIIFTKNTSEAVNLISYSYAQPFLKEGDEIVLSIAEHHSNLVPWQQAAKKTGAKLVYLYTDENGKIPAKEWEEKITARTKIVAVFHVSNVLGTENPIREIGEKAHEVGAVLVVDAAQSIPHRKVDVQALGADFLFFSGHKMLAPMGIGVLYGKRKLLEEMPPFLFGGDMIEYVGETESTFAPIPQKFEAGTQNVGAAAGLSAAMEYMEKVGYQELQRMEEELVSYAMEKLLLNPHIKIQGSKRPEDHIGVISFLVDGVHPHDVASILDSKNIAIRSGHHCAHPLMTYLGVKATCRASFYLYNEKADVDRLSEALQEVRGWLYYGSS